MTDKSADLTDKSADLTDKRHAEPFYAGFICRHVEKSMQGE
ncbi:hypothetical protein [Peribacillus sp. NPDC097225]